MQTQMEKVSYIIGRQIGGDFKSQGLSLDMDIFASSALASFMGEPSKLSDQETQTVMQAFQSEHQEAGAKAAGEASAKNIEIGKEYLEKNATSEGVKVTDSGLQYKVLTEGTGKTPDQSATVETHYEGKLIDGAVFDSSYQRGQPATFPVNGVIPGWTEALQLMKEGDVWELTIPSNLAYGEQGAGADIGPGATLIFKIELLKVL